MPGQGRGPRWVPPAVGVLVAGEAVRAGGGGGRELTALSAPFPCEPKTALKPGAYFKERLYKKLTLLLRPLPAPKDRHDVLVTL